MNLGDKSKSRRRENKNLDIEGDQERRRISGGGGGAAGPRSSLPCLRKRVGIAKRPAEEGRIAPAPLGEHPHGVHNYGDPDESLQEIQKFQESPEAAPAGTGAHLPSPRTSRRAAPAASPRYIPFAKGSRSPTGGEGSRASAGDDDPERRRMMTTAMVIPGAGCTALILLVSFRWYISGPF